MSKIIRRSARRLGIGACVVGLAAGALVVATSGVASARAHSTTTITLDHMLCYKATESGIKPPPNVLLENILQPAPFAPNFLGGAWHCNPANKSIPGALFGSKHPLAHLYCLNIEDPFSGATVTLSNQFGKAVMNVGLPGQLCLPSWKSNIAAPNMTPNAPSTIDHFTCYALKELASAYGFRPANVKAEDEFSAPKYVPLKLGIADRLCVPTTKIVNGVPFPPQGANDPSAVCFPTSPTPIWRVIWDQNQFGTAIVGPNTVNEQFCVPSSVSLQSTTG
jgi:hypothetical protein